MEYPDFIKNAKFTFDIPANDQDYRLAAKDMEQIASWRDFPSKKYEVKDDKGKTIVSKNKRQDFNAIVRYIMFVYDKQSPFHAKHRDVTKKKEVAVVESALPEYIDVMENDEILDMTVGFLMFQNDKLWAAICTNENLFSEYLTILNTRWDNFSTDKDVISSTTMKEKVRGYLDDVMSSLEGYYLKFYGEDKTLMEKVEKTRFSPESIGQKIK